MADTSGIPARGADSSTHTERIGFGLLMIGAPILMLGAAFLHPPHSIVDGVQYYHASHDHSTRFYVAHTLFFLAATLFVPAVVGIARLVHPSHARVAFWGCVLSLMGFIGYGAMDGMDYMAWVAGKPDMGLDAASMQQYVAVALSTIPIMVPTLLVFSLLPLGLAVLAVGTARAGILPGWLAALMPIGMAGVAGSLAHPVPLILSALALLASFGLVGVRLLRAPSGALSKAGPV